ncbi:MAG: hypothetical protein AAGI52_09635 [Bacteroidota bacterium]
MSEWVFRRWQKALVIASVLFALVGLLMALWPFGIVFAPWTGAIADTFFGGVWTTEAEAYHRFAMGPLGATMTGYFVLQTVIAAIPFGKRERWAWHAMVWGLVTWFVIDSAVSLLHGAAFNVWMINVPCVLVFGVILYATHRALR